MGAKCRIILPIQGVYTIPAHTRTTGCFYVSKVSHHRGIESLDWLLQPGSPTALWASVCLNILYITCRRSLMSFIDTFSRLPSWSGVLTGLTADVMLW